MKTTQENLEPPHSPSKEEQKDSKQMDEQIHLRSTALESADNAIVITDKKGIIVWTNPAFTTLTGYTSEEALGKNPRILNSGKHDAVFFKQLWKIILQGKVWSGDIINKSKDGTLLTHSQTITPVRGKEGQITHFISIKQNISKRIEAEEALQKSKKDLEKLNKQLSSNQAQLIHSEKMAGLGQLAAGVAHEINNPIAFTTSNIDTLTEYTALLKTLLSKYQTIGENLLNNESDKAMTSLIEIRDLSEKEDLPFIIDDVDNLLKETKEGLFRVREIVSNLKTFARIDEAKIKNADINECLETTLKVVWNELKYKCTIHKKLGKIPSIPCNAGQLNQVFMNLLVNAAQAIEEQGKISIETFKEGPSIIIRVSDTGSGISEKNIEKMFDPFFTTKPVGKGTGLGLSITHGIIESHHGSIDVKSELGKGTTFTIQLPIKGSPT